MHFVPVSPDQHRGKFLRPLSSFAYAAANAAVEVVLGEAGQVAASFPIFFMQAEAGVFKTIGLLGLAPGENLFVDSIGAWTGNYVPAMLRRHPFTLGKAPDGELNILIDEDAGLLSDNEGEPLFGTAEGDPNGPVARAIQFLTQLQMDAERTTAVAGKLHGLGLLKPTALNIQRRGGQQGPAGLLTIDEAALNALPDADFLELRRTGGLILAYAQMFSLGQIPNLQAKAQRVDAELASTPLS